MERLLVERSINLGLALDASTRQTYSSSLNSYLTFCELHHLDIEPTTQMLSLYITFMVHHIEPRSVRTYLTGIVSELEPFYPSVRYARNSSLVSHTLRGAMRGFSQPVRQKIPLTRDDLCHVHDALPQPLAHDDLLFLSLLFTGFFGLLRLGELVQSDSSSLRSSLKSSWRHSVVLSSSSYQFSIPRSKSDTRFEGDLIVIQTSRLHPDPLGLFISYLASRDTQFPLFPYLWLKADGSAPRRSWFLHRLHSFFPRAVGGHSMRAGGATSLAAAGVPSLQIQAIGRWNSAAFERYIHRHPTLLQAILFQGHSVHDPPFARVF